MFARYHDPDIQENNEQELELSIDLYTCPMTRQIIRHPVLASDGRRYELQFLWRYVQAGNIESPVRAGLGGIFPVLYDSQWKEMLDNLFRNHHDRFEDYESSGLVDEINDMLEALIEPQEDILHDANGTPINVAIGNAVFKLSFFYLIFSYSIVSIFLELLPDPIKDNRPFSAAFFISAMMTMAASLIYHESRIRIDNDNEYGILGGIANQYYSLFMRTPPRPPQMHQPVPDNQGESVQFPAHRMHR